MVRGRSSELRELTGPHRIVLSSPVKRRAGMIAPHRESASETILIVEDEVLIRLDVADYLRGAAIAW